MEVRSSELVERDTDAELLDEEIEAIFYKLSDHDGNVPVKRSTRCSERMKQVQDVPQEAVTYGEAVSPVYGKQFCLLKSSSLELPQPGQSLQMNKVIMIKNALTRQ
ncbi:hypothetical protein ACHWQZ_G011093 [Mnemiopsis leidyi]